MLNTGRQALKMVVVGERLRDYGQQIGNRSQFDK
jgi:hypothetical protein